jgi:hypothetical protein
VIAASSYQVTNEAIVSGGGGIAAGASDVTALTLPAATITALNPIGTAAGSPATPIVVTGTGITGDSTLSWTVNGVTTNLTAASQQTQLTATIPAALLTAGATAQIAIESPSGVLSNSLPFTIVPVYQLGTTVSPANAGTITANPASLNNYYAVGSTVCLTASPAGGQIFTGWSGTALNAAGCLTMTASASVTANFQTNPISATSALRFVPATPCRLVDTRNPNGPLGGPAISGGTARSFTIPGVCNIPSTALAYSLNLTVVPHGTLGYVSSLSLSFLLSTRLMAASNRTLLLCRPAPAEPSVCMLRIPLMPSSTSTGTSIRTRTRALCSSIR